MVAPAPLTIGWMEIGTFLLANVIIIWICAPRLIGDIRRWTKNPAAPGGSG